MGFIMDEQCVLPQKTGMQRLRLKTTAVTGEKKAAKSGAMTLLAQR